MRAILFGATGMIGQGVLRECLADPEVREILSVVRRPSGVADPKLRELVHDDFFDYAAIEDRLTGYDACFFCLGVSSAGDEGAGVPAHDLRPHHGGGRDAGAAQSLHDLLLRVGRRHRRHREGPQHVGPREGQDRERPREAPLRRDLHDAARLRAARPGGALQDRPHRTFYTLLGPLYPLWRALLPGVVTTTANVGRAMIRVAEGGYERRVLEVRDINALAERA
ncbi:MAG: epimerase [Sandaracinaceae bacterium]|nr:epimerase [Sandaracinaceae bacterium]